MNAFDPESFRGDLNAYCRDLSAALADGVISEEQWFEHRANATAQTYLPKDNPRAQSGHGGDEARWRYTRVLMVLEAIHKSGSFLDVGCANGHLIECLDRWVTGTELDVEFYGVDISDELVELAKTRLPDKSDRFFAANAVTWTPPRKFDIVHAHEISYAPKNREREFLEHLLDNYLNPGGRLIIGPWAVDRDCTDLEESLSAWGHKPTGTLLKRQGTDPGLTRKMVWLDKT